MPTEATLFEAEAPETWHGAIALQCLQPNEELNAPLDPGMVESLRKFGMLYPIGCLSYSNGENDPYRVLDGARRVVAARYLSTILTNDEMTALRLDPVEVIIVPSEYSNAEAITLLANYQRSPNPVRDFLALETALKRPGATPKRVARELGLEEREIGRLAKLLSLNEIIRQSFLDGEIAPGLALKIARMSQDRQTRICTYRLQKLSEKPDGKKLLLTGKEIAALFKRDSQAEIAALGDEVFSPGTALDIDPADLDPFEEPATAPEAVAPSQLEAELGYTKLKLHTAMTDLDHWKMCAAARLEAINDLHNSLTKSEKKAAEVMEMALGMVAGTAKELRKWANSKHSKPELIGAMLQAASSLEKLK